MKFVIWVSARDGRRGVIGVSAPELAARRNRIVYQLNLKGSNPDGTNVFSPKIIYNLLINNFSGKFNLFFWLSQKS